MPPMYRTAKGPAACRPLACASASDYYLADEALLHSLDRSRQVPYLSSRMTLHLRVEVSAFHGRGERDGRPDRTGDRLRDPRSKENPDYERDPDCEPELAQRGLPFAGRFQAAFLSCLALTDMSARNFSSIFLDVTSTKPVSFMTKAFLRSEGSAQAQVGSRLADVVDHLRDGTPGLDRAVVRVADVGHAPHRHRVGDAREHQHDGYLMYNLVPILRLLMHKNGLHVHV